MQGPIVPVAPLRALRAFAGYPCGHCSCAPIQNCLKLHKKHVEWDLSYHDWIRGWDTNAQQHEHSILGNQVRIHLPWKSNRSIVSPGLVGSSVGTSILRPLKSMMHRCQTRRAKAEQQHQYDPTNFRHASLSKLLLKLNCLVEHLMIERGLPAPVLSIARVTRLARHFIFRQKCTSVCSKVLLECRNQYILFLDSYPLHLLEQTTESQLRLRQT